MSPAELTRHLFLATAVIVLAAHLGGVVARRVGQPKVLGEIVAGIVLGPSILGAVWPEATAVLFPAELLPWLKALAEIGLVLFMFLVGIELDRDHLRGQGHRAVVVSHASIIAPFALGFGLGWWMPLGFLGLMLMISAPSMLIAWLKLRARNLGPLLDANGWAVNGRVRINVPFGGALTALGKLPLTANRSLRDPYMDKRGPWRLIVFLLVSVGLGGLWYLGKLDSYLPKRIQRATVLGSANPPASAASPASPAPL